MWSKFLWLNLIAIATLVVQYFFDNKLAPASWVPYEGLVVVVLNAIAGMIQGRQVAGLKAQLKASQKSK